MSDEVWKKACSENTAEEVRQMQKHYERLRAVLKRILDPHEPNGCPMCDSGTLRNPKKSHWPDCPFLDAESVLKETEHHPNEKLGGTFSARAIREAREANEQGAVNATAEAKARKVAKEIAETSHRHVADANDADSCKLCGRNFRVHLGWNETLEDRITTALLQFHKEVSKADDATENERTALKERVRVLEDLANEVLAHLFDKQDISRCRDLAESALDGGKGEA